ncbi:MAG: magnesium and cobalt exporter, family [Chthoniobacter sp.]|nr:magnesium and cobalt exporter, family [Chthoniobacter sp.]
MIWLGVAACLVISFMFSGIEAGILSVNRVRLRHRVKLQDRSAIVLQRLLAQPGRLLVTVLLVTNFMNICALTLVTQEWVPRFGVSGYALAGIVALPIYLFGLELLPKSLFRRFPYRALAALSQPLRLADLLLSPVLNAGAGLLQLWDLREADEPRKLFVAREDFKYLTIESERDGTLTKVEREMIHNVVDFRKVLAKNVMLPMEKVRTVPTETSVPELLRIARETATDQFPVVSAEGRIVGLVAVFDVLVDHTRRETISSYQRRIVSVPPNEEAYHIIRKLRAARITVGAVQDAEGRPLGLVQADDFVSHLVKTATS